MNLCGFRHSSICQLAGSANTAPNEESSELQRGHHLLPRAGKHLKALLSVVAVALGFVAPGRAECQDRRWLEPLEEVRRISDEEGTLLGDPRSIRGSPRGGFALLDWGEMSVREYSPDGELLWRFGGRGDGPGEFPAWIVDLEYDREGSLLVMDMAMRVTTLDPSGALVATEKVLMRTYGGMDLEETFGGLQLQLLPDGFAPGHAFMHTSPSENSRHLWSSESRRVETPSGVYEGIDGGIVAVRWAANAPDGEAVVYHRWSDVMILLDADGSVRSVVRGIETVEFPDVVHLSGTLEGFELFGEVQDVEYSGQKVDPKAVEVTVSVAVDEDRIFVLFLGNPDHAIVDTYSRDGEYAGSYRLPDSLRTHEMAVLADGSLAFIDISFVPTVVIMRPGR
ncbi:MAG: hypothetical protein OXG18_02435 [Gemmatimonadetes bacterium]|nr:hypothetical protein [Gemmatimonadota bacterium]